MKIASDYVQMSLFDMEPPRKILRGKPLIQSLSLTWCRTICPYCKLDNPDSENKRKWIFSKRTHPYLSNNLNICPQCGNEYDRDHPKIVMSRDYAECEKLGLKGAVYKDKKGVWHESKI